MGRKRTACNRCAGIKTVCSKHLPCSRCKRLGLPCEYHTTVAADGSSTVDSNKKRSRAEHTRSPNGCVNCVKRRKKCDEQTPICSDCKRLGLSCVPRRSTPRRYSSSLVSSEASSPGHMRHTSANRAEEGDYEPAVTDPDLIDQSGIHSDFPLQESAPYLDWIALIDDDGTREVARRDNLRDSSAMIVLPEARVVGNFPALTVTGLNNITGVTPNALKDWSVGEKHLLHHFQQVVSRALVVVDDHQNPFLLDIVPMALEYAPVRDSLVALSACHLSKVYPDFERNVLRHRSLALQGLKNELNRCDGLKSALATTLLLCLLEICEGNSRKWILHLHGAKALISDFASEAVEYPLRSLFELYSFLCCITSITSDKSPSVPDVCLGSPVLLETGLRRQSIHPWLGIARDLYAYVYRVNKLAIQRLSLHGTTAGQAVFSREARDIELLLQGWTPPEGLDDSRESREITAVAQAIQWAGLMRLHQVVHGNDVSARKVQVAVESILSALSVIRPGSQVEAHILFPLFMAGIGSTTKTNRLTVEYRLNIIESTIGFGNITGTHKLLDSVWQRMNEGEVSVDWELLMQTEYAGIVLL